MENPSDPDPFGWYVRTTFTLSTFISASLLFTTLIPFLKEKTRQGHEIFTINYLKSITICLLLTSMITFLHTVDCKSMIVHIVCLLHGILVQYCHLTSCTWLNIIFIDSWKELCWIRYCRIPALLEERRARLYAVGSAYAWGVPLIMVFIIYNNLIEAKDGRESSSDPYLFVPLVQLLTCFYIGEHKSRARISYIGFLLTLMLINFILLFAFVFELCFKIKGTKEQKVQTVGNKAEFKKRKSLCKKRVLMYSEVLIVMCGYTLIMITLPDPIEFWYLYPLAYFSTAFLIYSIYSRSSVGLKRSGSTESTLNRDPKLGPHPVPWNVSPILPLRKNMGVVCTRPSPRHENPKSDTPLSTSSGNAWMRQSVVTFQDGETRI